MRSLKPEITNYLPKSVARLVSISNYTSFRNFFWHGWSRLNGFWCLNFHPFIGVKINCTRVETATNRVIIFGHHVIEFKPNHVTISTDFTYTYIFTAVHWFIDNFSISVLRQTLHPILSIHSTGTRRPFASQFEYLPSHITHTLAVIAG